MYGEHPQIIAGAQMPNQQAMERVLDSTEWLNLTEQLLTFVTDFSYKIIPARKGFQL